jgi:hypothetical protein
MASMYRSVLYAPYHPRAREANSMPTHLNRFTNHSVLCRTITTSSLTPVTTPLLARLAKKRSLDYLT